MRFIVQLFLNLEMFQHNEKSNDGHRQKNVDRLNRNNGKLLHNEDVYIEGWCRLIRTCRQRTTMIVE